MKIKQFTFNPFQENTFIISDDSKECIIIDPGCYEKNEELQLENFIIEHDLSPKKLINTHCHIDHILGNKFVSNKWNIDLYLCKEDLPLLRNSKEIAKMYGFNHYQEGNYKTYFLEDGDTIEFGNSQMDILFTPGHAPGHICLLSKENKLILVGDVLFNRSIGRTDLPGGNLEVLINSIKNKLLVLEDDIIVYCGHGPPTTIGQEKESNPFL